MIRSDLHIHTVLSPCGDIEMTPLNIIKKARELSVGIIGITDHNSTLQCSEVKRIGEREGAFVMCGAEITTREEVHAICFVEDKKLTLLQDYLSSHLPHIPNKTEFFGYQLVVNEDEEIIHQEPFLLISALNQTLDQVETFVHSLGGIFIPAHIDKKQNSLLSQLGFFPPGLRTDAVELSPMCDPEDFFNKNTFLKDQRIIYSSDAHYPQDIGRANTFLEVANLSFEGVKEAICKLKTGL
jgi:hypothetical protein